MNTTTDTRTTLALKAGHQLGRPVVDLTALPKNPKTRRALSSGEEYLAQRREWMRSNRGLKHAPIFLINPRSTVDYLANLLPEHAYWIG